MVFTSVINFVRSPGPDQFWKKRRIFKLAAHYIGRRRNCYSLAIRGVHHALVYATKARHVKKLDMAKLWDSRVDAGCVQHDINPYVFKESLTRSHILLNRKVLADLACWEPFSFKAITDVAKITEKAEGIQPPPKGNKILYISKRGSQSKT